MARAMNIPVTATLASGLRVVAQRLRSQVECCGFAINAGSRDELTGEEGLAHFVEHTIFKGTVKRRAHHISSRMEGVGGELNAYTTKEETFFYTMSPAHNHRRSIDLLCDLMSRCTFPASELDKERQVVADEIDTYLDMPADAVFDDFEDKMWADSGLGHNILGTKETVASFDTEACRRWVDRMYRPGRMVFFYAGPQSPERIFKLVNELYAPQVATVEHSLQRQCPVVNEAFDLKVIKDIHQAHTLTGVRIPGLNPQAADDTKQRYVLALYNNILGGPGMNSRLNMSLREKSGLVYTVESTVNMYDYAGELSIYYGCDREDVVQCRRLVAREMERLAAAQLTPRQLAQAIRQYQGQVTIAQSSVEAVATSLGKSVLRNIAILDDSQRNALMASISARDIQDCAIAIHDNPSLSHLTFL